FSFIRKVHTQPALPASFLGSACIQHLLLSSFLRFHHLNKFLVSSHTVLLLPARNRFSYLFPPFRSIYWVQLDRVQR
ncbi:hypothetical protein LEMLEM_LOCUS23819, partial [Lemmus lemmus]